MYYACIHTAQYPKVLLKPSYLQQGVIGESHNLVCLIALSSKTPSNLVTLAWNFTSNDSRVAVIPTTITVDNSIGIVYTTVIQFAYMVEEDEDNYTCTLTIEVLENDLLESTFNLEIISE